MSDRCLDDQVSAIDLSANVNEFFAEVVHSTIEHRGYEATDAAAKYVVGMLADYTRPGQLGEEALSRPLTLLLDEAMKSSGHERFEKLRTLGDGVLYVSGFDAERLTVPGPLLKKPFSPEKLVEAVRDLLGPPTLTSTSA